MRLQPDIYDWLKVAILAFVFPWLARRYYVRLENYKNWKSPLKRALVVSPLIIVAVVALGIFFYAWTHN